MSKKKLITYDSYSDCSTLTFGANEANTSCTIGGQGTVYDCESMPDILYQSVVLIRDEAKMWMRGSFVSMGGGGSTESKVYCSLSEYQAWKQSGSIDPDTIYCITNIDCDFEATEI